MIESYRGHIRANDDRKGVATSRRNHVILPALACLTMLAQDAIDILGLNTLLAQLILAVGASMVFGNGYAIYMHHKGRAPARVSGEFRAPRAWWLLLVGLFITTWGAASLIVG